MGSLCLGILSSGRFCQQGEEGVSLAQSTLTRVEFLCRSLCWTEGWCWGQAPGFLEASGFQQPLYMGPAASGTTC